MKVLTWTVGVGLLLAAGCQHQNPLVEKAELPIDSALIGSWAGVDADAKDDDKTFTMVVLPFSANEYAVIYGTDGDGLYFRAYRGSVAGMPMMQMQWLGYGSKTVSDSDETYVACRYELSGDTLTIALANNKILLPGPTAEMVKTFTASLSNPELFEESVTFKRIVPEQDPPTSP